MPAKSKAQQRFFGMVHAAQKGEIDAPSEKVAKAAKDMKPGEVKKFASTKSKNLPEKVKKESFEAKIDSILNNLNEETDQMTTTDSAGAEVCKLCGVKIKGPGGACATPNCPNSKATPTSKASNKISPNSNIPESKETNKEIIEENKMADPKVKKLSVVTESARGRITTRMKRMLEVASNGRSLDQGKWKELIGESNFDLAGKLGLLKESLEDLPGAPPAPEGEPAPAGLDGLDTGAAPELPPGGMPGAEGEVPPEEQPLTAVETKKILTVLKQHADDDAVAIIAKALDEEMGELPEAPDMTPAEEPAEEPKEEKEPKEDKGEKDDKKEDDKDEKKDKKDKKDPPWAK